MMEDERMIKLTWITTPTELRDIANKLEKAKAVNVNWYHTVLTFENKAHNSDWTNQNNKGESNV
jgi:hypothetical protein